MTMNIFTVITVLFLSSHSRTSGSVSESRTEKIQPGENVTLSCIQKAADDSLIEWIRVTNRTKASCISSMFGYEEASFCNGFGKDKYKMMANKSKIFLHIKHVDFSDSGLYFCGFYLNAHIVISETTYLNVQVNSDSDKDAHVRTKDEPDGIKILIFAILGGLSGVLAIVTIALAVKIMKLQTAVNEELRQKRNENLPLDDLNYATIKFQANQKRKQRPATRREIEPNVIYAATR